MNPNPYKHLLDPNQPSLSQQQQQISKESNTQAYVQSSTEQKVPGSKQRDEFSTNSNVYVQDQSLAVQIDTISQNFQIETSVNTTRRITNKNSFMWTIVSIYILQYFFTIGFVVVSLAFKDKDSIFLQDNEIAPIFWVVLLLTIAIPIAVYNIRVLQQNPISTVVAIVYLVIYTTFQASLIAISIRQQIKKEGDHVYLGDYFWLGLIGGCMTLFNILGLIQLTVLSIVIRMNQDTFTLRQFQRNGVLLSIMIGMLFIYVHIYAVLSIVGLGIIFIFWFSYGLARVSDENFGLKQDETVFGSFAVFLVMTCPFLTRI